MCPAKDTLETLPNGEVYSNGELQVETGLMRDDRTPQRWSVPFVTNNVDLYSSTSAPQEISTIEDRPPSYSKLPDGLLPSYEQATIRIATIESIHRINRIKNPYQNIHQLNKIFRNNQQHEM